MYIEDVNREELVKLGQVEQGESRSWSQPSLRSRLRSQLNPNLTIDHIRNPNPDHDHNDVYNYGHNYHYANNHDNSHGSNPDHARNPNHDHDRDHAYSYSHIKDHDNNHDKIHVSCEPRSGSGSQL